MDKSKGADMSDASISTEATGTSGGFGGAEIDSRIGRTDMSPDVSQYLDRGASTDVNNAEIQNAAEMGGETDH